MRKIFSYNISKGIFWFRIFGKYGIHIKDITKSDLLFSERNRFGNYIYISNYIIKFLK